MPYQGVGFRFVALLIDAIILGIISYLLIFLFAASAITVDTSTGAVSIGPAYYAALVLGIVIELLYFTLLLECYGLSVPDGIQDKSGQRGRQRTDHLRSGVCTCYSAVC